MVYFMTNISRRFFSMLILVFILNLNTSIAVDNQISSAKATLDELTSIRCGNYDYLNCLGMSKSKCNKLMLDAFNSCPLKYIKSLDLKLLDPACNANQFVDLSGISPELFKSCGKYLNKGMDSTR